MVFREKDKEMEKNEHSQTLCRLVESRPCRCCSCFTFVAYIGHHIFVSDTAILKGRARGITGLAFSTVFNILTSSVGDGVLCAWNTNMWFLMKFVPVNMFIGEPLSGETRVQIHPGQVHLLVIQQWMMAVYNTSKMKSDNELEQEFGIFVNLKHLEDKVVAGEWDELERYLLGFTKIDENLYSEKMFFEIRQQKYLEALNRNEKAKAHEILMNDLAVFSSDEEDMVHKEISRLMTLNDYRLEQESGIFVNLKHLEDKVVAGEWDELERYLLGFTKIDENVYSEEMFFEIRQQKYLEALNRNEKGKAHEILMNDLAVFSSNKEDMVYKEISRHMTLKDYREHKNLRDFVNAQTSRNELVITIEDLIGENPKFHQKYEFPSLNSARLITVLSQSRNMQHSLCENPRELPIIETYECESLNGTGASTSADIPSTEVANSNAYLSFGIDIIILVDLQR